MKHREWSPFCFPLLLFSSPFGGGIMQVKCAPTWWKGYRKESCLCINRTGTIALPNKGWLLMDICMNSPHLFCIQPLIMVLSSSQSWLMVVGMPRTVDSADLILGRVGKKQCKTAPTRCLQLRQLLWVPCGRSGGNQGFPGAWSLWNETAVESITAMMEGKSFMADRSMRKIAQSQIFHTTLNGNSDFTHTYFVPFSIQDRFSFNPPQNDCAKCVLLFQFYKWGNWDSGTTRNSLYSHSFIHQRMTEFLLCVKYCTQ